MYKALESQVAKKAASQKLNSVLKREENSLSFPPVEV